MTDQEKIKAIESVLSEDTKYANKPKGHTLRDVIGVLKEEFPGKDEQHTNAITGEILRSVVRIEI